jgi:hypothetical protein
MGEARRILGDLPIAQDLVAVGMDDDHRRSIALDMPVDAFVGDVQRRAIAVEQLPQPGGGNAPGRRRSWCRP